MQYFAITALLIAALAAIVIFVRRITIAGLIRERAFDDDDVPVDSGREQPNFLTRWLALAGYRQSQATGVFLAVTLLNLTVGLLVIYLVHAFGTVELLSTTVRLLPGAIGEIMVPVTYAFPWILGGILATAPWLVVRRARMQRVYKFEQDLPLALDLLSTLSESGLGFDTALARILETRLEFRPLAQEFHIFQRDLLAGRGRVQSLRRLSQRVEIPSMSIFVSALVQAEQSGMGIAGVLRRQAEDLRDRRRERANSFANSLPVKRMVPMVICFMPGIFVWAIGPVMLQLIQVLDRVIQQR